MSMPEQAVQYQSDLLRELVEDAKNRSQSLGSRGRNPPSRIEAATTEQDIATVWAELNEEFQILDENQWAR